MSPAALPTPEQLARWALQRQHPLTREWTTEPDRLVALAQVARDDLRLATDLDIARIRTARFAAGQPPELMLDRWVETGDGLAVLLGMRYEGGEVTLPFVDASVATREVRAVDLPALRTAAVDAYGVLDPTYVRIWSSGRIGDLVGTRPDRRFVAAPLALLRASALPVPTELRLRRAEGVAAYDQAVAAYAAVDADHDGHPRQARLQSLDGLAESAEDGTLFEVLLHGRWAGYAAATTHPADSLGMSAYVVQELVLAASARGHGFGGALSVLLARELPPDRDVLTGTIHAANAGAIRAALAAGRVDVGGWSQLPLVRQ